MSAGLRLVTRPNRRRIRRSAAQIYPPPPERTLGMPVITRIPVPMRALLAGARRKEAALLDLTRKLVQVESPSDDKAAVDACMALAVEHARGLGGRVKLHKQRGFGNVLEARFGAKSKTGGAGRVLLLGH